MYSGFVCVSGIGSAVHSKRFAAGVQPSRSMRGSSNCSSRGVRTVEEDDHVDRLRRPERSAHGVPAGEVHVEELRGVREVFGQQPVAGENIRRVRQKRVGRLEARPA